MNAEVDKKNVSLVQKVHNFFWWSAGAVVPVLRKCPTEYNKYAAIGVLMIFILLLASVSFSFFLFMTFKIPFVMAIPFGLVWGILIFCLDRVLLTSFRKGEASRTAVLQRFILTAAIAVVIGEPLLIYMFQTEVDLELAKRSQVILKDARTNANARFQDEAKELKDSNDAIQSRLETFKKERDAKEQTVIEEIEGKSKTGKSGIGIAARQKQTAFTDADIKYKNYRTESADISNKNNKRLDEISLAIENETKHIGEVNTKAKGVLSRHKALLSLVFNDRETAYLYVPLFAFLLLFETLPLTIKVFGKKGVYDTALESSEYEQIEEIIAKATSARGNSNDLRKMRDAYNKRFYQNIEQGNLDLITDKDQLHVAKLLQAEILNKIENDSLKRQANSFDYAKFSDEIVVEVVGHKEYEFYCQVPKNARENLTLETLSGDIQKIAKRFGENLNLENAYSSIKGSITTNLPLIPQLGTDGKMFLEFETIGGS